MLSYAYTILRETNPIIGFAERTNICTDQEKEREDQNALGIRIVAPVAIVLDRHRGIVLLRDVPLVRLERQTRTFLHLC